MGRQPCEGPDGSSSLFFVAGMLSRYALQAGCVGRTLYNLCSSRAQTVTRDVLTGAMSYTRLVARLSMHRHASLAHGAPGCERAFSGGLRHSSDRILDLDPTLVDSTDATHIWRRSGSGLWLSP